MSLEYYTSGKAYENIITCENFPSIEVQVGIIIILLYMLYYVIDRNDKNNDNYNLYKNHYNFEPFVLKQEKTNL